MGAHLERAEEPERLAAADDPPGRVLLPDAREAQPVFETRGECHPHVNPTGHPFNEPDHHGVGGPRWHAVDEADHAGRGAELGLQDEGVGAVPAPDPGDLTAREICQ